MNIKVILGPNASGKTTLLDSINKEYAAKYGWSKIQYLTFRDSYGTSDSGYYLQQRWNDCDCSLVPSVREALGEFETSELQEKAFSLFNVKDMMDKLLVQLSSGELRKFQLAKALARAPRVLIMDSPYIGLDSNAREQLNQMLQMIASLGLEIILVLAREQDIPSFASSIKRIETKADITKPCIEQVCKEISSRPGRKVDYENAAVLKNVCIRYGNHYLLKNLNWTMKAGEKWALKGPNGSGKSTLLSIICADIPQAYACDVTLFDIPRGSGESVWDIKKHIGFVSPELHRAYSHNVSVTDVVASGFHDRQGLYLKTTEEQIPECLFWLNCFGIEHLKDRSFLNLSSGEQRLVLLARAFVKDPDLLILDEPLHGLDDENGERVKSIINAFCSRIGKSLIMVSHYNEDFPSCMTNCLELSKF